MLVQPRSATMHPRSSSRAAAERAIARPAPVEIGRSDANALLCAQRSISSSRTAAGIPTWKHYTSACRQRRTCSGYATTSSGFPPICALTYDRDSDCICSLQRRTTSTAKQEGQEPTTASSTSATAVCSSSHLFHRGSVEEDMSAPLMW